MAGVPMRGWPSVRALWSAGLRTGLQTIGQLQMTGDTYLSAEHAPLPHLGASGHADLGRHHRVGTDFDIVGDLHQIVELHAATNVGAAHRRAVNASVGANFDAILHGDEYRFAESFS